MHVSSQMSTQPRRTLTGRQVDTVETLFLAASELLDEVGHEQITIRLVAQRAGVSPATAYTYFASKDHLFAELFWRLFDSAPRLDHRGGKPRDRVQRVMAHLAETVASAPALAAAVNKSMLANDPEVERLRVAIGRIWIAQIAEALGGDADPRVLETLGHAFSGALLQAGMGMFDYAELGTVLGRVVDVIVDGGGKGRGRLTVRRRT